MSTKPMTTVGRMHSAVNTNRYRFRPPVRSDIAPSTGETAAFSATLALAATVNASVPLVSPSAAVVHGPMAKLTMAKLKIVLAKSYRAQDSPSTALPERVRLPMPCHQLTGFRARAERALAVTAGS